MDRHSYFLAVALAYVSLAFLLAASDRPRRGSPTGMLVTAFAATGVAYLLQGADDALPFWLSAVGGNVLAWLGLLYMAWAILALSGRPITRNGRLVAGAFLLAVVVGLLVAPPVATFAGANLSYSVLFVYIAVVLVTWREVGAELRWITATLFIASAVLYGLRALGFVTSDVTVAAEQVPELEPWVSNVLLPLSYTTLISSAFGLLLLTRRFAQQRLEEATDELARLAAYDELTGLPNRRYVIDRAQAECSRAERSGSTLCVAVVDLDGLKAINDAAGHLAGDAALQRLADACRAGLRQQDLAARIGGDEFAVLLPESDLPRAQSALVRVLAALATDQLAHPNPAGTLSASIGVAEYQPGESIDDVFARADAAMYTSKKAGGGIVTVQPLVAASTD